MSRACGPKTTLFFINLIVVVLGITILGVGIYLNVDKKYTALKDLFHYDREADAESRNNRLLNLNSISFLLIIIGSVMTVVSLIGIFGACCENRFLIIIYCIIISMLFVSVIGITIAALVYKYAYQKNFTDEFKTLIVKQIQNKYQGSVPNANPFTISADIFMISFECCGVYDYKDFNSAQLWNRTVPGGRAIAPIACCKFSATQRAGAFKGEFPKLDDYSCAINPTESNSNYLKGCFTEMNSYLNRIVIVVIVVTAIIGFLLLLATTHSCYLCCVFNNKQNEYDYRQGYRRYQQFNEY